MIIAELQKDPPIQLKDRPSGTAVEKTSLEATPSPDLRKVKGER